MPENRLWTLGVTGGVASGKTLATDELESLGCFVVDADRVSRGLTAAGGRGVQAVRDAFGPGFVTPEGAMDRTRMRDLVFSSPEALRRLESVLHPLIRESIAEKLASAPDGAPYAVLVVPLLSSAVSLRDFSDRILVIDSPLSSRIARAAERPGITAGKAAAIAAAQAGRTAYLDAADDILENSGSREELLCALRMLHGRYLALAALRERQMEEKKEDRPEVFSVRCPICGKDVPWTAESRFKPFCSEQCRLIDLGEWASGGYRIEGKPGSADSLDPGAQNP